MKATGINIEWGSPAGYCARGINRCFGGQVFARAPYLHGVVILEGEGVWCHVFQGIDYMNSKPSKAVE